MISHQTETKNVFIQQTRETVLTVNSSSSLTTPGSASSKVCRLFPVPSARGLLLCRLPTLPMERVSSPSFFLPFRCILEPIDLVNFFRPLCFSKVPMLRRLPPTDWAICPMEDLCFSFLLRFVRLPDLTVKAMRTSSSPRFLPLSSLPGFVAKGYLRFFGRS